MGSAILRTQVLQKGVPNGVASLDGNTKVPVAELPYVVATGSTDNAVLRADGTDGVTTQGSLVTITDLGSVNIPIGQSYKVNGAALTYSDVGADASGAASTVQSNLTTHINLTGTNVHGLGDASMHSASEFDAAGAASTVQSNLTTHIGLSGTSVHGLGSASTRADTYFVAANGAITGATNTKITYDSKGLVTSGAAATTADIADSLNKRYVTDAQLTVIGNTSGSNSGDETTSSIKTKLGAASGSADGYLTSSDWTTFNGKIGGSIAVNQMAYGSGSGTIQGSASLTYTSGELLSVASGAAVVPLAVKANASQTANLQEWRDSAGVALASVSSVGGVNIPSGQTYNINGTPHTHSAYVTTDQTSPQSVVNGQLTFSDGIKLGTNPTVGAFAAGKLFYDSAYKTISAQIDGDVTLQLGQEEQVLCWNNSGTTIPNGSIVRQTGSLDDMPTIILALADTDEHSRNIMGMTTQAIADGASGLVTCRGIVHDLNTAAFTSGDTLYLSSTTPGGITNIQTTDPSYFSAHIGTALIIDSSAGSVYVSPQGRDRLVDLNDVTVTTPSAGDNLIWSGAKWVNKPSTGASVGTGVTFYLDNTDVIPAGAGPQTLAMKSLAKTVSATQYNESALVNNSTALIRRFSYNTALGVTTINSGVWTFNTYCYVSNASQISTMPVTVRRAVIGTGTIAITGTGTSRTATITGSTPLVSGDYDADITLTGLIETPNGVFTISGAVGGGGTTCDITTLSTYDNETNVAFKIHKFMFTDANTEVNQLAVALTTSTSTQPAFSVNATDKLSLSYYARTTSTSDKTLHLYYGGATYANFTCPLLTLHNEMPGLQGGSSNEYYHLTSSQYTNLSTGSVAATQVVYGSGTNAIAGSVGFSYDATNRRLGVSDSSSQFAPSATLHLSKDTNTGLRADTYSNTPAAVAGVQLYKARGTAASPTAVQADDSLGFLAAYARGATGFSATSRAKIEMHAAENWTDAAHGTYITFETTPAGSTTSADHARLHSGGCLQIGGTYASVGAVSLLTIGTNATTDAAARVQINTGADANHGLVVQRNSATQSASLTEWQMSNGTVMVAVTGAGNLDLAVTTNATQYGIVSKGGTRFLHDFSYGLNGGGTTPEGYNIFLGQTAGNFTMGSTATQSSHSSRNIGIGYQSLTSLTTGFRNIAIGTNSLQNATTAFSNTAIGYAAGANINTGNQNTAIGNNALNAVIGVGDCTAVGAGSLQNNTASYCTAVGSSCLLNSTTGQGNTAIGYSALRTNSTGGYNTAVGISALYSQASGVTGCVAIGAYAGYNNATVNSFFVGNVQQSSEANDQAYSLLWGTFSGSATSLTNQQLTINGTTTVRASADASKGLIVKRFSANQTANLTEWQMSGGTVMSYVDKAGIYVGLARNVISSVSGNSTLSQSMTLVQQTASGITTSLWASPTAGDTLTIKNDSASSNVVSGNGKNIESSSSMTLIGGDSATLVYDGTKWIIFALGGSSPAVEQWVSAPASSSSTGIKGQRAYDGTYTYECVATNTWVKHSEITSF